jgi:fatty acid desaturase
MSLTARGLFVLIYVSFLFYFIFINHFFNIVGEADGAQGSWAEDDEA